MKVHDSERAVAVYLNLSVSVLRKRRRLGLPPTFLRIGRRVLYARADVDDFLAAQRVTPVPGAEEARPQGLDPGRTGGGL